MDENFKKNLKERVGVEGLPTAFVAKYKGKTEHPLEPALFARFKAHLEAERPLRELELNSDELKTVSGYALLTLKPLIVVLNHAEGEAPGMSQPDVVAASAGEHEARGARARLARLLGIEQVQVYQSFGTKSTTIQGKGLPAYQGGNAVLLVAFLAAFLQGKRDCAVGLPRTLFLDLVQETIGRLTAIHHLACDQVHRLDPIGSLVDRGGVTGSTGR